MLLQNNYGRKKVLGYTVDEKIGSGGFGTVYKVSKTNASGTAMMSLNMMGIINENENEE